MPALQGGQGTCRITVARSSPVPSAGALATGVAGGTAGWVTGLDSGGASGGVIGRDSGGASGGVTRASGGDVGCVADVLGGGAEDGDNAPGAVVGGQAVPRPRATTAIARKCRRSVLVGRIGAPPTDPS